MRGSFPPRALAHPGFNRDGPFLGPPINNIGDGLNGGSEKVGTGCAGLNSAGYEGERKSGSMYNAHCRSFVDRTGAVHPVTR